MATIRDVAEAAGVSVATVSNYINKTKPIRRDKAERIAAAIHTLGYVPNLMARTLRRRAGSVIGVLLPNVQDQYYVQILQGIEQYCNGRNYFVSLGISGESAEQEKKYLAHFSENQAAGMICVSCLPQKPDTLRQIAAGGTPLVCIDRRPEGVSAGFLHFDNQKTMMQLTKNCISRGCKHILLVCGPSAYSCEQEAEAGFNKALTEHPACSGTVLHTALNKEAAFRAMLLYLQKARPDAVLATAKSVAAAVLESLMLAGLSPSADVFVGALGEDNWDRQSDRPDVLYTARQAITLGKAAAAQLFEQMENPGLPPREQMFEDVWLRKPHTALTVVSGKNRRLTALMLDTRQVELFSGLVPYFEQFSGVKTEIIRVPEHEMLAAIQNPNQTADVAMFDLPWLYSLAKSGVLADISGYMEQFDESIYLHNCLEHYGKFGGGYYGLPFTYAPQMLFYRRDLFENPALCKQYFSLYNEELRPPKSWSAFNRIAAFFDRQNRAASPVLYGTVIPTAYKECLLPEVYMRMRAYGGEVYNSRFQVHFNTPQTVKALGSLAALAASCPGAAQNITDRDAARIFLEGSTAMQITYPSFVSDTAALSGAGGGVLGFAHIPGKCPVLGGWSLGILQNAKQKDAAFDFITWACGAEMANYSAILAGQSAISASFENNELISLYPWLPLYRDMYAYAEPILPPHKPGRAIIPQEAVDSLVSGGVYALLNKQKTPEEAAESIGLALSELFKRYRY